MGEGEVHGGLGTEPLAAEGHRESESFAAGGKDVCGWSP